MHPTLTGRALKHPRRPAWHDWLAALRGRPHRTPPTQPAQPKDLVQRLREAGL